MRRALGIAAAAAILLAGCGASHTPHSTSSSTAAAAHPPIHGTIVRGKSCVPTGKANIYC